MQMKPDLNKIYDGLFTEVEHNMSAAGEEFHYYRETLLTNQGQHPRKVDVGRYDDLPNERFYQAAFVGAFKRLPEETEEQPWRARTGEPQEQFRREALGAISRSSVFAIQHMELMQNPYVTARKSLRYRLLGALYGLTDKSSLRTFGKKLPGPIQKVIRKVFI